MTFSPEQDQYMQLQLTRVYYEGLREGVRMFAHWKDGVQYVGTTGRKLKEALAEIELAEKTTLTKYSTLRVV